MEIIDNIIRYISAVDLDDSSLSLRREWFDIDSHQKTILSDDWGVGFTMHWLAARLGYQTFCDGRYFITRLHGLGIASVERPPETKGTFKSPDFVTLDQSGKFHLVECKGTQSNTGYLEEQLIGGSGQKRKVIFTDEENQVGQRLAAGIFAAKSGSNDRSLLAISDPPPRRS
jgi:hypothetical protein